MKASECDYTAANVGDLQDNFDKFGDFTECDGDSKTAKSHINLDIDFIPGGE